jgi:PAS domain S-box-containing protein
VHPPNGEKTKLDDDIQRTILDDILARVLPLTTGLTVVAVVFAVATGRPGRQLAALTVTTFTLACWFWFRRGRSQRAVNALIVGVGVTALVGMALNGGMRAPAVLGVPVAVVVAGWAFDRRGATIAAVGATMLFLTIAAASTLRLLPESDAAAPLSYAVVASCTVWLIWAATSTPVRRLRTAIRDSVLREAARHAEEQRRHESELAFEAIFDQTAYLMLLLRPDGTLVSANRAALEFLGASSAESIVGGPFADTPGWPDAARATLRDALQKTVAREAPSQLEVRDDASRVLDVTLSPFRDAQRRLRYVIVEGRDISALLKDQEQKSQARRMELVGRLAGGVAHDFNNVLAVVLSCTELLKADLEQRGAITSDIAENLANITDVTERASDLTRRLLTFGRRVPMEKKEGSMHELIESTAKLLRRTLPSSVTVETKLGAPRDRVAADASSVESVLLNLAINARDAMANGGTLTISTEGVDLDEAWCRESGFALEPGAYLRVSVRDTGSGISPDVLGRVFEPFFTTKAEGKGTGIGLASVLSAMQDHGGSVHVETEAGRGTVFHLMFPLSTGRSMRPPAGAVKRDFSGLRGLVVDDEPALRNLVGRILGRMGIESVIAADAEQGLIEFEKAPESFDFAILDVVLPGRRGSELAVDLLAGSKRLRVLLVSGFPSDAELSALPRDRVELLSKPFTSAGLHAALTDLLSDSLSEHR